MFAIKFVDGVVFRGNEQSDTNQRDESAKRNENDVYKKKYIYIHVFLIRYLFIFRPREEIQTVECFTTGRVGMYSENVPKTLYQIS